MSTRGTIAMQENSGTGFNTIYNHFDSYPEALGKKLYEEFNTNKAVAELISMGDCSYPGEHYHASRGENWDDVKPIRVDERGLIHGQEFSYVWMPVEGTDIWTWFVSNDGAEWEDLETVLNREGWIQ